MATTLGMRVPLDKPLRVNKLEGLIERLQSGDDSALEPFIEATRDFAYRLAYSFLRDRHLSEDVLQESYLVVYRKISGLRREQAFRTWFARIISNRCRRLLREKPSEPLEAAPPPVSADPADQISDRIRVERVMASLNEQDRIILNLREWMQLTYEEIAELLDLPLGTVRSRLSKARFRLLKALTEEESG